MSKPLADEIGFLLSRASGVIARAMNAALAEHGLRVRPYSVLALAYETPEGRSQRDLAAELGLDPSQVVILVDDLVTAGLVERRPAAIDRRTKLVVVTATGRAAFEKANRTADSAMGLLLASFSPDENDLLRDMLSRVVRAGTQNAATEAASQREPSPDSARETSWR